MRKAEFNRKTNETDIKLSLNLDGSGLGAIDSGSGFFDHMLMLFSKHSGFDLTVVCKGDSNVDYHHSAEDIGIVLGKAFALAAGDKCGIKRYASIVLPMDEALILSAVDISGRGQCFYSLEIPSQKIGEFDTELCEEFFNAFAKDGGFTLHIRELAGCNSHHIVEGAFKSVARCLRDAVSIDSRFKDEIPSTKGVIE